MGLREGRYMSIGSFNNNKKKKDEICSNYGQQRRNLNKSFNGHIMKLQTSGTIKLSNSVYGDPRNSIMNSIEVPKMFSQS